MQNLLKLVVLLHNDILAKMFFKIVSLLEKIIFHEKVLYVLPFFLINIPIYLLSIEEKAYTQFYLLN